MKIGILTFHWAANYGAVLQAYALQKTLENLGNDVQIIDYYPERYKKNILYAFKTRHLNVIPQRFLEVKKEKKIEIFRKKCFNRSKYYKSDDDLKNANLDYDLVICGSDQIWNESFLRCGEGKKTYTYFLDFVKEGTKKASYAASFGTESYDEKLREDLGKMLKSFDFISVREKTGLDILKSVGIEDGCVVPDPTLLLDEAEYKNHVNSVDEACKNAFVYMLHGKDKDAKVLIEHASGNGFEINRCKDVAVDEWLSGIYNSNIVITNSFHGIVFSIIFKRPFAAILINGSGMNDRISTLLQKLDLSDRIFDGDLSVIDKSIDWENVCEKLDAFKKEGLDYINSILN